MTRLERLREEHSKAKARYYTAIRLGDYNRARAAEQRINALEKEIEDAEAYQPKLLSEQLTRRELKESGIVEEIIKTHVAADYFCDVCTEFRFKMDALGLADCSLYPLIRELEKASARYAALVCHPEFAGLQDFLISDETLIKAIDKKVNSFMKSKLQVYYDTTK